MHDFVQVFPRPLVLLHIQNPLALPHVLNPLVLLHVLTPLVLFDVLSLLLFLLVLVVTSSPGHSKFWILPYSHMVWDTALSLASHCTGFRHLSVLGRSHDVFIQSSECCELLSSPHLPWSPLLSPVSLSLLTSNHINIYFVFSLKTWH